MADRPDLDANGVLLGVGPDGEIVLGTEWFPPFSTGTPPQIQRWRGAGWSSPEPLPIAFHQNDGGRHSVDVAGVERLSGTTADDQLAVAERRGASWSLLDSGQVTVDFASQASSVDGRLRATFWGPVGPGPYAQQFGCWSPDASSSTLRLDSLRTLPTSGYSACALRSDGALACGFGGTGNPLRELRILRCDAEPEVLPGVTPDWIDYGGWSFEMTYGAGALYSCVHVQDGVTGVYSTRLLTFDGATWRELARGPGGECAVAASAERVVMVIGDDGAQRLYLYSVDRDGMVTSETIGESVGTWIFDVDVALDRDGQPWVAYGDARGFRVGRPRGP